MLFRSVDARTITEACRKNPLLHRVDGKWEFIEGWRYFIAGKDYLEAFVDSVQELFAKLALLQFTDPPKPRSPQERRAERTPRFAFTQHSFLSPHTTIAFRALLRAVRRLRTEKRNSGRDRMFDVAMDVVDHLVAIGPVRSDLAVPLCSELFVLTDRKSTRLNSSH